MESITWLEAKKGSSSGATLSEIVAHVKTLPGGDILNESSILSILDNLNEESVVEIEPVRYRLRECS